MIIDTLFKNLCPNISPSSPPWYPPCTSEKCIFYSFLLLLMMTMGALENLCKNDLGYSSTLGHKSIVKISWKNHQKSSQSGALFRHRIQVKVVFVRDVDNDKSVNLGLIEREKNNEQKFKWWLVFDINDQLDVDAVQRTESLQIMPFFFVKSITRNFREIDFTKKI